MFVTEADAGSGIHVQQWF